MIARPVHLLATWLSLATCSLGSMAPGKGLLLCLGLDGHIDVSSVEDGCNTCVEPATEDRSDPCSDEAGIEEDDSCCPCVDIPVVSGGDDARHQTVRPVSDDSGPLAAMLPAARGEFVERANPVRLVRPAPLRSSGTPLAQLRSVVLIV